MNQVKLDPYPVSEGELFQLMSRRMVKAGLTRIPHKVLAESVTDEMEKAL